MEALSTAEKAGVELSPVQEAALLALLRGGTQAEAARESGAGERTVRRWLRCPSCWPQEPEHAFRRD
jgi:hypothetical protein